MSLRYVRKSTPDGEEFYAVRDTDYQPPNYADATYQLVPMILLKKDVEQDNQWWDRFGAMRLSEVEYKNADDEGRVFL